MRIVIGKQNVYTYTFNAAAKTLAISGVLEFSPNVIPNTPGYLVGVYDAAVGVAANFNMNGVTVAKTIVAGLPVWTFTFPTLPSGVANGDTLTVSFELDLPTAQYSLLRYSASKV